MLKTGHSCCELRLWLLLLVVVIISTETYDQIEKIRSTIALSYIVFGFILYFYIWTLSTTENISTTKTGSIGVCVLNSSFPSISVWLRDWPHEFWNKYEKKAKIRRKKSSTHTNITQIKTNTQIMWWTHQSQTCYFYIQRNEHQSSCKCCGKKHQQKVWTAFFLLLVVRFIVCLLLFVRLAFFISFFLNMHVCVCVVVFTCEYGEFFLIRTFGFHVE